MSRNLYLAHYGVKGQKHGERKYQNKDGSLTPLGRAHYGVGKARGAASSAVKSVAKAIRKKVAPTNVELNAQIRKEKSKILNKQKREELKRLKKTGKIEDPEKKKGPHKRFSEMSDADIDARINRLKKEATLAELEASKNIGPGKKMVLNAISKGLTTGIQTATQSGLKSVGETFIKRGFGMDKDWNEFQEKKKKEEASKKLSEHIDDVVNESKAWREKEEKKKKRAEDFKKVVGNIKNETSGYRDRYAANFGYDGKGPKEKDQKAKVNYTWDPDDPRSKKRKK